MATQTASFLPISISTSQISRDRRNPSSLSFSSSSFRGNWRLTRRSCLGKLIFKYQRSTMATVLCSLPTQKYASAKIPKWSARAIRSFGLGELEARKLKYPNTGTEALLMGILIEGP
uniref:Uncharacterized protein n=1 Tax=Rhizophora mucronata TaxID=61149 RepID=A0A2P2K440_RHIMU